VVFSYAESGYREGNEQSSNKEKKIFTASLRLTLLKFRQSL